MHVVAKNQPMPKSKAATMVAKAKAPVLPGLPGKGSLASYVLKPGGPVPKMGASGSVPPKTGAAANKAAAPVRALPNKINVAAAVAAGGVAVPKALVQSMAAAHQMSLMNGVCDECSLPSLNDGMESVMNALRDIVNPHAILYVGEACARNLIAAGGKLQ